MFTGIVESIGNVCSIQKLGKGLEFGISSRKGFSDLKIDNSICVNGVCLTVVKRTKDLFYVQCVEETLQKTNLGSIEKNGLVNLERSVKVNARLGGHIVQGHVDTTGKILLVKKLSTSWMVTVQFPKRFRKYLISVGSITVDGTSLTVARLEESTFTVAIIPYTYHNTVFQTYKKGTPVNLEFDVLGKYLESLITLSHEKQ